MLRYFPLSLRLTDADEIFQLRFALDAAACLKTSNLLSDVDFETSGEGLTLFADTEEAFAPIVAYLKERHFESLEISPVRVRYRWHPMLLEPVMAVRVRLSEHHFHLVTCHLLARGADIMTCPDETSAYDIYAQAPLARLLGIRGELKALCGGACYTELQLFGYFSPEPASGPYDYAG
ncbi:MAG: hypothetical protein KKE76_15490 [Gammaproteobacteria bacterium]|nr:hypothetical protein [Gammaproteobacteria bacterium]